MTFFALRGLVVGVSAKKFALLGLMVGVSAKKFAQRTKNGPKSAVCGVLGEFFAEEPLEGPCRASFFAERQCCGRSSRARRAQQARRTRRAQCARRPQSW